MTATEIKKLMAQISGLNLAQNESLIGAALNSTLEEIGVVIKISNAINSVTKTIAASANYVTGIVEYSQIVSVTYEYTSGGVTFRRVLDPIEPTEYAQINAGMELNVTDELEHYCPKSGRIYVGPGNSYTGGSLIIEYQRKLAESDIPNLPDGSMVLFGGLSNLLPSDNPERIGYRNMFDSRLRPAITQARPTLEKHSSVSLGDQLLRDEMYLRSL